MSPPSTGDYYLPSFRCNVCGIVGPTAGEHLHELCKLLAVQHDGVGDFQEFHAARPPSCMSPSPVNRLCV